MGKFEDPALAITMADLKNAHEIMKKLIRARLGGAPAERALSLCRKRGAVCLSAYGSG